MQTPWRRCVGSSPAAGHPLALFGTGRPIVEERDLLEIFALYLLNRQAFCLVGIVSGVFKTMIPLVCNRMIDAIVNPAAAAALENKINDLSSSSIAWGQGASDTAHKISAALNGVSGYLGQVEGGEVWQRAQELGTKAKEGMAAAGSWGWGTIKRVRGSLGESGEHALTAISSVSGKIAAAQVTTTAVSSSAPSSKADTGPSSATAPSAASRSPTSGQAVIPTAIAHPTTVQPSQQPQQVFSLGEDRGKEVLGFITSMLVRSLRDTVVPDPEGIGTETPLSAFAAGSSAAFASEQQHLSASASSSAVTAAVASQEPASLAKSSAASAGDTEARRAPAALMNADLDAKFDKFFGDLTVTTVAASYMLTSPLSKRTAFVD